MTGAYYDHFDAVVKEATGEGGEHLFATDLSEMEVLPAHGLLPVEADARTIRNAAREALDTHYAALPARQVTSSAMLLRERVAPPTMVGGRSSVD